ncbi:MAG: hypothetical protein GF416_05160 [Candidatus Altiarchaeales archaeon]|nr:hypothetical protein [Candidatus Altiarchaeales archaeon]MBD3416505.1 hypothetical protein [Candidatus Altiarchaeales archaeon]
MNTLEVRLSVPADKAEACLSSIQPEIDSELHDRSSVKLEYDKELILTVTAKDLHAMRAAANTYIRWLDMSLRLTG